MSDTSPTPIPTAVSDSSPTALVPDAPAADLSQAAPAPSAAPAVEVSAEPSSSEPVEAQQAAPDAAPVDTPPASDVATAGAATPAPEVSSAPSEPAAAPGTLIDTPAKALETLGPESGVPAGTKDVVTPVSDVSIDPSTMIEHPVLGMVEHPHFTLERLRAKLHGYGEECLAAVREEIEHLQKFFDIG